MGLAPIIVKRLLEAVARVARQQDTAVLLVEQHVRKALGYCDRAYVMHRGRVELEGSAPELLGRIGDIEDHYLTAAAGTGTS
jgi:branched-chain amino acid transport system ATP-binding protein